MSGNKQTTIPVAIFASGAGSNAEKIIERVFQSLKAGTGIFRVNLIVCNKPGAGVLKIAAEIQY